MIFGKDAGKEKNPYTEFKTQDNYYYVYLVNDNNYFVIDVNSKKKINDFIVNKNDSKNLTFYILKNGYIGTHFKDSFLYLHQIIMDYFGNGSGTKNGSVDHIDRNKLNNIFTNLRIVDHETQQQNKIGCLEGTKRKRQYNARPLPDGITQEMIPKYVEYKEEIYNKEKNLSRIWFCFYHPKLEKRINSSKSNNVSIEDKLEQIKKIVEQYKNGKSREEITKKSLPQSVSFNSETMVLSFDKRTEGKFYNKKMKMKSNNLSDELKRFEKLLSEKYPDTKFNFSEFYTP